MQTSTISSHSPSSPPALASTNLLSIFVESSLPSFHVNAVITRGLLCLTSAWHEIGDGGMAQLCLLPLFLENIFSASFLMLQPLRSSFLWGILMVRVSGTSDVLVSVAQAERV